MGKREVLFLLATAFTISTAVVCEKNLNTNVADKEEVENIKDHDDPNDYIWNDSEIVHIVLNGNTITVDSIGATVDGSKITITSAGTYSISGSLTDGQVIVNTEDVDIMRLILNGVNIHGSTCSPVYIKSAEKTVIVLADSTENYITDGTSYVFEEPEEDEPNAAIFSKSNLTIYGNGKLTVDGNYNDAIASKDGLIIKSGTIIVTSVDDGIRGKDYLVIKDGNITVHSAGDGLKSDNEEDAARGYISMEMGVVNIVAGRDAVEAATDVLISGGEINLIAGGGSTASINEEISTKGIKAGVSIIIDGETIAVNSSDDAIHSNERLQINGGSFVLSTGDDGMHADSSLEINGGDINITKSYEGIESAILTINSGEIHIISSDDGLNAAGGNDGSGRGGEPGRPPQDPFATEGNYHLDLNSGYIAINAQGDGFDINGPVNMNDGRVIIHGPTANDNGALDYFGTFNITGGFLVGAGSSGMAEAPGLPSTQYSVLINFRSVVSAGTLFHVQTAEGEEILSFVPAKRYQSIVFSSPQLTNGSTYDVYLGGSSTGTVIDGLYQGGTYTPGTKFNSFTISGIITKVIF